MHDYLFRVPVILTFSVRSDCDIEGRKIAASLAVGKIDLGKLTDPQLNAPPPHDIRLLAKFNLEGERVGAPSRRVSG